MLKSYSSRQKCKWAALGFAVLVGGVSTTPQAQAQSPPLFQNATLSPKFSPDPAVLKGITGGSVAAKDVAGQSTSPTGGCLGFMDAAPNHTIELKAFFKYLKIQTQSLEDTTIVVKGPGGTWCNDDLQDKNAGLDGEWLSGTYQVWIGTYNKDKATPYTLRITEVR